MNTSTLDLGCGITTPGVVPSLPLNITVAEFRDGISLEKIQPRFGLAGKIYHIEDFKWLNEHPFFRNCWLPLNRFIHVKGLNGFYKEWNPSISRHQFLKAIENDYQFTGLLITDRYLSSICSNPESWDPTVECPFNMWKRHAWREVIVQDALRMMERLNLKFNWKWSLKRWIQEHDKAIVAINAKDYSKEPIKLGAAFRQLALRGNMTLLDSPYAIAEEGRRQRHCVASYVDKVRAGECVIISVEHEGDTYTMEVEGHPLRIGQFEGKFRKTPPQRLRAEMEIWLLNQKRLTPLISHGN